MARWDEVTTYEGLQGMPPDVRAAHFRSRIVLDPSALSSSERQRLVEMRERMNARMEKGQ